jgi:hypothetical protein
MAEEDDVFGRQIDADHTLGGGKHTNLSLDFDHCLMLQFCGSAIMWSGPDASTERRISRDLAFGYKETA